MKSSEGINSGEQLNSDKGIVNSSEEIPPSAVQSPANTFFDRVRLSDHNLWCSFWLLSIIGFLIRASFGYSGYSSLSGFFGNILGCFVMGCLLRNKLALEHTPWLFIGLTTGLCGSMTTFSGYMLQLFRTAAGLYDGPLPLAILASACPIFYMTAFFIGSKVVMPFRMTNRLNPLNCAACSWILLPSTFVSMVVFSLLAAFDVSSIQSLWMACLFAPFGTFARFMLTCSIPVVPRFALPTFIVNVSGTVLVGGLFVISRKISTLTAVQLNAVTALSDGFTGCYTTISTMVGEATNLPFPYGISYVVGSAATGQIMLLLVVGIPLIFMSS